MKKERDPDRRGLGKLVYSVDSEAVQEDRLDTDRAIDEIGEASRESFPASDPPGYTLGAADETAARPIDEGAAQRPPPRKARTARRTRARSEPGR